MTFSIVARSDDGESWGVAVASKFLGVGAVVPAAVAQVGAVATQADANVAYKGLALSHLDEGATAPVALQRLLEEDDGRDDRQVGIVDVDGGAASHTGAACIDWAGGRTGDGYAVQGNCLAGEEVVEAMERTWLDSAQTPFAARLLAALRAGDEAGGDKRGRQSAALLVVREEAGYAGRDDLAVDLRVDDHAAPVPELARLLDLHELYLTASTEEEKVHVGDALRADLEDFARTEGHPDFATWVGTENYEMRVAPDLSWIDQRILDIVTRGVLVVGAGPTGATVRVVEAGRAVATGEASWATHSPRPGWAEHPAEEAWQAVLGAARTALASYDTERLGSVSVDAAHDLVALWDVDSLGSPRPLIGAADLRADEVCTRMREVGHDARVAELSGRPPDPRLAGPRLAWIAEHEPHTWALVGAGRYAVGGLDAYLVARMTRGVEHLTDPARAARTQLLDVATQEWSAELCDLFGVPADALPELVPAAEPVAETDPTTFLGLTLPLAVHIAVQPG